MRLCEPRSCQASFMSTPPNKLEWMGCTQVMAVYCELISVAHYEAVNKHYRSLDTLIQTNVSVQPKARPLSTRDSERFTSTTFCSDKDVLACGVYFSKFQIKTNVVVNHHCGNFELTLIWRHPEPQGRNDSTCTLLWSHTKLSRFHLLWWIFLWNRNSFTQPKQKREVTQRQMNTQICAGIRTHLNLSLPTSHLCTKRCCQGNLQPHLLWPDPREQMKWLHTRKEQTQMAPQWGREGND